MSSSGKSNDSNSENEMSNLSEGSYTEIDVTENPLFQILAAFFQNDEGETICDHLKNISKSIDKNTEMLSKVLEKLNH